MLLDAHHRWLATHGRDGVRFEGLCPPPPPDSVLRLARLGAVQWAQADLGHADLRWADLAGARLSEIRFDGDARSANLHGADLRDADLRGADLRDADLRGADLRGARLFGARLDGARTTDARLDADSLGGVVYEATMRDLQARALASGGLEWIRSAVDAGQIEVSFFSANGEGSGARLVEAIPYGTRPADDPRAALVAQWLAPEPVRAWSEQLAMHAAWVASEGREGRRLSAPVADLRPHVADGLVLAWATLSGADLTGVTAADVDLTGADLARARLTGARFTDVRLDAADLTDADLTGADLGGTARQAVWLGVQADGARLPGAMPPPRALSAGGGATQRSGAILSDDELAALDLRGANLSGARLSVASLADHDLSDARLDSALIGAAQFGPIDGLSAQGAALSGARFGDATGVDLRGADLREIVIDGTWRSCDLRGAVLLGAHLEAARFIECDLRGAALNTAHVAGTLIERSPVEIHVLAAADLDPIRLACASLAPDLAEAVATDLVAGRPCAWRAVAHPVVHAWLVVLDGPFGDLRTLTAHWVRGEAAG